VRAASSGQPALLPTVAVPAGTLNGRLVAHRELPLLEEVPPRPLYVFNVTLDYANGTVHAQQRIEFANPAGQPIAELKFNVPPARRPGAVTLHDVRLFGQADPLPHDLRGTVLTVKLPAPLPPDKAIAMTFDFTFKVPLQETTLGIGGDDTSRGPYSLTCGHWYIMLAPYRNGEWDTPAYVPIGDPYTSELADHEANILAPEGIIIAAGGDESREGRLWRYSLPKARVFAFAASNLYRVEAIQQDGISFIHYVYPEHRHLSAAVLNAAANAVRLFSRLYGPYPYRVLRIVETDRQQGQEYSGLIGIGAAIYAGYRGRGARHDLIATTVHEVAHQWWFNVVGSDQVRAPWLDEALARYSELRFYQEYHSADADWWFEYFILSRERGPLVGAIDLAISEYPDSRAYINAVYRRGLIFLNELRKRVGTQTLDAALKDYYESHAYRQADQDDFFDALARHTTQDIRDLVRGFFANAVTLPCRLSGNAPGCRQ